MATDQSGLWPQVLSDLWQGTKVIFTQSPVATAQQLYEAFANRDSGSSADNRPSQMDIDPGQGMLSWAEGVRDMPPSQMLPTNLAVGLMSSLTTPPGVATTANMVDIFTSPDKLSNREFRRGSEAEMLMDLSVLALGLTASEGAAARSVLESPSAAAAAEERAVLSAGEMEQLSIEDLQATIRSVPEHYAEPRLYDVGLAKDLRNNPLTGSQVHHVPQTRQADSLVGDFNLANRAGNEPAIRLSREEHEAVNAAQRIRTAPASARDLLADEIRILRNETDAPNSALQKLIELNKRLHRYDFEPLHRLPE
jgi:hypothetical protein